MKKTALFLLTVALFAMASEGFSRMPVQARNSNHSSIADATDGAFRDGLYLGKLDAQAGRARHLSVGRWSADPDRALFKTGYEAGYREASALSAD